MKFCGNIISDRLHYAMKYFFVLALKGFLYYVRNVTKFK